MENLLHPTEDYPFEDIIIKTPKALQGGTFCANLEINDNPIIIQTPKCKTKNGIHKTAKQLYCDLLFDENNEEFINWMEKFQDKIRDLIFENNSNWFHEDLSMDDIEYHWNDSLRSYKRKQLLRTFIHKSKRLNKVSLQIYDTDENELSLNDVTSDKKIISIIEIVGLKFSSQSFHLEISLRQIMVINEKPLFNKCLIRINNTKKEIKNVINQSQIEENDLIEKVPAIVEETQKKEDPDVVEETPPEETPTILEETQVDESSTVVKETPPEETPSILEKTPVEESIENENSVKNVETTPTNLEIKTNNEIASVVEKEFENKKNDKSLEKTNDLEEIELNIDNSDTIKLKEPNEVYLNIYKAARDKAKMAKIEAIKAYLEAKKIKELYMLDIIDSSDEEVEDEVGYVDNEELFSEN